MYYRNSWCACILMIFDVTCTCTYMCMVYNYVKEWTHIW